MNKAVFTEHPGTKTMTVERTFDAPVARVWHAWTDRETLEKWWAPQPYTAVTKSFDFCEGGHWHFAMRSPEGERDWCWLNYLTIERERRLAASDFFCDEAGTVDEAMPANQWDNRYEERDGKTYFTATLTFVSVDDMQRIIEMGFKDGFSTCLDQLEGLLA